MELIKKGLLEEVNFEGDDREPAPESLAVEFRLSGVNRKCQVWAASLVLGRVA